MSIKGLAVLAVVVFVVAGLFGYLSGRDDDKADGAVVIERSSVL